MKKIASVAISIVLLAVSFGLVSCGEMKDTQVYGADIDKTYFTASFVVSQPSVKEKDFTFPLVTKDPVKEVTDLEFYFSNEKLEKIETESIKLLYRDAFKPGENATPIKTNDYRYVIEAKLNIFEITDPIKIDSITMKINGYEKRFQVDITITYKYIDYSVSPDYYLNSPVQIVDWETTPGGLTEIGGPIRVRRQTVLRGLKFRSIPISPTNILIGKQYDPPVPFEEGMVLDTLTTYRITVFVENAKLDHFYDESIDLTVTEEGLYDTTLYGDLDKLDASLFYHTLKNAENIFFS